MYYLMFIYTFLLSLKTSWIYNNFTFLSYQKDLRFYYLVWVCIISCFLLIKVIKLFKKITYLTKYNKLLISFSFTTMIMGSFLPYHPDNENIISTLHIILSTLGAISLLIIIQLLINRILVIDFTFYKKMNTLYHHLILMLGMLIIMFGSINSIIELFFTFIVLSSLAKIDRYFHYFDKEFSST